jgi:signal transduction histidine kinase
LQQVLVNLINNAIDAMPQGGRLGINITNGGGGEVAVNISDTGRGITEENQGRIFDPFFTTKPAGKGTGLGLAVSYGIIRDHGGEIRVSSIPDKARHLASCFQWRTTDMATAEGVAGHFVEKNRQGSENFQLPR